MGLKEYRERFAQERKEKKAFKAIVAKRTLQERRKAFAEEAVKVAAEKGREQARRGTFGQRVWTLAKQKLAARPSPQAVATRRRVIRRVVTGRVQPRTTARKRTYRRAPLRRAPVQRAQPVRQAQPAYKPISISDFI